MRHGLKLMIGSLVALGSQGVRAAEPVAIPNVAVATTPPLSLAVSLSLKFRMAPTADLAGLLVESGVDVDDAAAADRLAAGYDGHGRTGCFVEIAIARDTLGSDGYRLQRMSLRTETGEVVMERRNGAIAISAVGAPKNAAHRIA